MKYIFDVNVVTTHYKQDYTVIATDDIDARKQAVAKDKKEIGADYKHEKDYRVLYCETSLVRTVS